VTFASVLAFQKRSLIVSLLLFNSYWSA